jgi:hypothetical protein
MRTARVPAAALCALVALAIGSASAGARPAASSTISVVGKKSFCFYDTSKAAITYYVTLRNAGPAKGTTRIRPWRRYSDKSVNDGSGDVTPALPVPGRATRGFQTTVAFDPEKHVPQSCRVYLGRDGTHYSSIKVVGG